MQNGDGELSKTELKKVLHADEDIRLQFRAVGGRHWQDFWQELDVDGDGRIQLPEMIEYFREHAPEWHRAHMGVAADDAREAAAAAAAAAGDEGLAERVAELEREAVEVQEQLAAKNAEITALQGAAKDLEEVCLGGGGLRA